MKIKINTTESVKTSDSIVAGASATAEFLRIPEVQRNFGIKRGKLYEFIRNGSIKSINLRKKGAKTGLRLICVTSLRNFLLSHMEGGDL